MLSLKLRDQLWLEMLTAESGTRLNLLTSIGILNEITLICLEGFGRTMVNFPGECQSPMPKPGHLQISSLGLASGSLGK